MNAVTSPPPQPNRLPISKKALDDLANRFTYHAPKGTQQERYVAIREKGRELAELMAGCVPESRELSLALTHLQQSTQWANAGIACNE